MTDTDVQETHYEPVDPLETEEFTPEEREQALEEFNKLARQAATAKDQTLGEDEVNIIGELCLGAVDKLSVFGTYIAGALLTSLARSYAQAIETELKDAA